MGTDEKHKTNTLRFENDVNRPIGTPGQGEFQRSSTLKTSRQCVTLEWVLFKLVERTSHALGP